MRGNADGTAHERRREQHEALVAGLCREQALRQRIEQTEKVVNGLQVEVKEEPMEEDVPPTPHRASKVAGVRKSIGKPKPEKLYFVVMSNMFNAPFEIHRRYDLKGSWVGRETPLEKQTPGVALKDVDFLRVGEKIGLGEERRARLLATLEMDSRFLASNNIIDYSLLLGIHEREEGAGIESTNSQQATSQQRTSQGEWSSDERTIYFMGIIDILTPYDGLKKMEHTVKAVRYDSKGVSCCPPVQYAARFNRFMEKAFV